MTSFFSMALAPLLKKGVYLFNKNKTRSTEAGFAFSKRLFDCMFHRMVHICRMFIGFIPWHAQPFD